MIVLGLDPGLHGGAAVIQAVAPRHFVVLDAIDIPLMGEGNRQRVNVAALARWLYQFDIHCGVIERVGLMPDQNVASGGKFMRAVGMIEATALLCGIDLQTVESQVWKKRYGLLKQNKEASRQKALELFPGTEEKLFPLKKHHNRAEAALIGRFGCEYFSVQTLAKHKRSDLSESEMGAHDGATRKTGGRG